MATETKPDTGTWALKTGLAQMLKGGVIMDVVTPEQAKIAENAGAVAVMALERVPSDIRKMGGVARMSDPQMIAEIIDAVTAAKIKASGKVVSSTSSTGTGVTSNTTGTSTGSGY